MSRFDEQPDGDPHGECAAEIDKLKALNAELAEALEVFANKYDAAPDGDLGIGLVNGDFARARAALAKQKETT